MKNVDTESNGLKLLEGYWQGFEDTAFLEMLGTSENLRMPYCLVVESGATTGAIHFARNSAVVPVEFELKEAIESKRFVDVLGTMRPLPELGPPYYEIGFKIKYSSSGELARNMTFHIQGTDSAIRIGQTALGYNAIKNDSFPSPQACVDFLKKQYEIDQKIGTDQVM